VKGWRCPNCGSKYVEVVYEQLHTYTEEYVGDTYVHRSEKYPEGKREIVQVLCLTCNQDDTTDKYWHMSESEFYDEKGWEEDDYYTDVERGT